MSRVIGVMLILVSMVSNGETVKDANVLYTGLYGNGNLFIVIDKPLGSCTNNTWIIIPADHQNKGAYFTMAMASVVGGKKITAHVKCDSGVQNTVFEDVSYIHINK
ncbi:MAG: hypothetical protein HRT35_21950 [Algicola sp.]|nr:hypothetical protein [Algicola sp.]